MRGAAQPNAVQVLSSNSFRNNARVCVCLCVFLWIGLEGREEEEEGMTGREGRGKLLRGRRLRAAS